MPPRHHVSRAAIDLIKRFEGYRRQAAQLPDGRWTIGYGHTLTARAGAEVSEADAEALLLYDMIGVAHTVSELSYAALTRNQFDALCAFAFSIGLDAFRSSDVLKRVNEGAFTQAAFALELWRKAEFEGERIVVDALVRRRAAEKLLFLTPPNGDWRAAPSAVLQPLLDETAPNTAPRSAPVQVTTSLDGPVATLAREQVAPEPENRVTAAAEAVTARLQTLFADPEPQPEVPAPRAPHEPLRPEAAEPVAAAAPAVPAPQPEPEPAAAPEGGEVAVEPEVPEPETVEPAVATEAVEAGGAEDRLSLFPRAAGAGPRIFIDDTAPFEFVPPKVQPIEREGGDGLLAIVTLIVLGLAFFAGGVFWALNAAPQAPASVFTPLLVGWLAGVAGVGFVAAGVFMLLQRVTRAADRRDRRR